MQLLLVLAALTGVLFSVRAAAVPPLEERSPLSLSRVRTMLLFSLLALVEEDSSSLTECVSVSVFFYDSP